MKTNIAFTRNDRVQLELLTRLDKFLGDIAASNSGLQRYPGTMGTAVQLIEEPSTFSIRLEGCIKDIEEICYQFSERAVSILKMIVRARIVLIVYYTTNVSRDLVPVNIEFSLPDLERTLDVFCSPPPLPPRLEQFTKSVEIQLWRKRIAEEIDNLHLKRKACSEESMKRKDEWSRKRRGPIGPKPRRR